MINTLRQWTAEPFMRSVTIIRGVWSVEKILEFGPNPQKSWKNDEKSKFSFFQNLFMVGLWLLGSRFQPFRNVSDHFWSTSDRFKPTGINYKQILKKWKFWFFWSEISSLIGSRVGGLGRIFPVYEGFKVELLQKICKSIHDPLQYD